MMFGRFDFIRNKYTHRGCVTGTEKRPDNQGNFDSRYISSGPLEVMRVVGGVNSPWIVVGKIKIKFF